MSTLFNTFFDIFCKRFVIINLGGKMKLSDIKSIGDKSVKLLNNLSIYTPQNLLEHYPYRYNIINITDINNSEDNIYIKATIVSEPKVSFIKRNFNRLSFKVISSDIEVNVVIFNRAFLKQNITINKDIVLYGKYNSLKNTFSAADIKFNIDENTIEPVYRLTSGLKQSSVKKFISSALSSNIILEDKVPTYITDKYNFIAKDIAIKNIHLPMCLEDIKKSKVRLIYEELFEFMFKVNYLKEKNKNTDGIKRSIDKNHIDTFKSNLKFELTVDQEKAVNEIYDDMTDSKRMNRLVLGDVGSGKTVIASYAIYNNHLSGYQSAFMVPTEILAMQHYFSLKNSLSKFNICVDIITGKMTTKEKKMIKERLLNGEINLLIGTHSLISDEVVFNNLGLVITDEQHRFGVMQRKNLENKGDNPDILYLSATPIPRTYALILYGDSDVSIIKTKPIGRKEINTKVVKEKDIKEVLLKMLEEIKNNRQVFVVSPLIEDNEETSLNSVNELKNKLNRAFNDKIIIDIVHGAMKEKEKDLIMTKFKNNEINILISTTVIEVGIDIPNATVMTIFNAERFGLATLHQLRGRVGRNDYQSYCYLISDSDNARLKVMEESNDGFYITEKDFENRKEGDLFGVRQSGDMVFKIADLKRDYQIVMQAQKDAEQYVKEKKYLEDSYYNNLINEFNTIT